jgi:hypothetical protein
VVPLNWGLTPHEYATCERVICIAQTNRVQHNCGEETLRDCLAAQLHLGTVAAKTGVRWEPPRALILFMSHGSLFSFIFFHLIIYIKLFKKVKNFSANHYEGEDKEAGCDNEQL